MGQHKWRSKSTQNLDIGRQYELDGKCKICHRKGYCSKLCVKAKDRIKKELLKSMEEKGITAINRQMAKDMVTTPHLDI